MKIFVLFLLLLFSASLLIQVHCQSLIHQNLVVHIDSLTSISKKGRGITNGGANEAANYIRDVFMANEVPEFQLPGVNGYFQEFPVKILGDIDSASNIMVNGKKYYIWKDFAYFSFIKPDGFGELTGRKSFVIFPYRDDVAHLKLVSTQTNFNCELKYLPSGDLFKKTVEASVAGNNTGKFRTATLLGTIQNPSFTITTSCALSYQLQRIANKSVRQQHRHQQVTDSVIVHLKRKESDLVCKNIIGLIPGTTTDSCIIISAHYDHLGILKGQMYPGANDNASGVAVLLETARHLMACYQKGWRPAHHIVFIAFSAEEVGLLGSHHFVNYSGVDVSKIKRVINLDMVGGVGNELKGTPEKLFLLHSSDCDLSLIEVFKRGAGVSGKISFSNEGKAKYLDYSDQRSFIEKGVPSIFIFSGEENYYHTPSDTKEHLNFTKMEALVDLLVGVMIGVDMP